MEPTVGGALVSAATMPDVSGAPVRALQRGELLGRYVIMSRLGAGAMGVVYAAYDPELDRKIAIKVIQTRRVGDAEARTRMLREAQALAKLAHPNVVAIYDVGVRGAQLWLAMEFVSGATLGDWLRARPRGWREVVGVIAEAGRGLTAAHAAGILHRDVKPENLMVADDGRARVMDFGLARGDEVKPREDGRDALAMDEGRATERAADESDAMLQSASVQALSVELTRQGAVMGTPAYMAPEQLIGAQVDARADVFSLCVTLWEALYGERPFAGETLAALSMNVVAGIRRDPPRGRAPSWIRRVCERGLEADAARRWPDMTAFVRALEGGQSRSRRRRALAAFACLAAITLVVVVGRAWAHARRVADCERVAEIDWSEERRDAFRRALLDSGISFAASTVERLLPRLDQYAREWSDARVSLCMGEESSEVPRAQLEWCLEDRRERFVALRDVLMSPDIHALGRAIIMAAELPEVRACSDATLMQQLPTPPAEQRASSVALQSDLYRAEALVYAGAYEEGAGALSLLEARVQSLRWPPLRVRLGLIQGYLLYKTGELEEAERALEDVYFEAAALDDVATQAKAVRALCDVVSARGRPADALRWTRFFNVAVEDLGGRGEPLIEGMLVARAAAYHRLGDFDAAERDLEEALARLSADRGADHPKLSDIRDSLATLAIARGDYPKARAQLERSLEKNTALLGADHPHVATIYNSLATVAMFMNDYETARGRFLRVLEIRIAVTGPRSVSVGESYANLAVAEMQLGELARARATMQRALELLIEGHGARHPAVAHAHDNLGNIERSLGEYAQARASFERALELREELLKPEHPHLATTLGNLGEELVRAGEHAAARPLFERALKISEKVFGAGHSRTGYAQRGLAEVALAEGRPEEALRRVALAIAARRESAELERAEALFTRARILWETPARRGEALADAGRAIELFLGSGASGAHALAEAEAWRRERERERE